MRLSISYRASQFWKALAAAPTQTDLDMAKELLPPKLMDLFLSMQPSEQAHSIQVCSRLIENGQESQDLLVAALLHDLGKSRHPLHAWERVLIVIVQKLSATQLERWGKGDVQSWKRPFVVAAQHPSWGAEMAQQAGASDLTVRLILRHQEACPNFETPEDELLRCLQQIDNES